MSSLCIKTQLLIKEYPIHYFHLSTLQTVYSVVKVKDNIVKLDFYHLRSSSMLN